MKIKELQADKLKVEIFSSREEMGKVAAEDAAACIKDLLSKKKEIYIIFAAAPSQNEFLASLVASEGIDWTRVHALHMDEYVGLPDDAPQGFGNFLRRGIFDKVPFASVELIGTSADHEATIRRYTEILGKVHVDIVCMGIGENGHIAFNDPHVADFNDPLPVKKVDLDEKCRMQQVHDGCFKSIDEVPKYAITLTVPTLYNADHLFCMVPAATKADAVKATVCGEISAKCPATILRRHTSAKLYLDPDSGKYLL